MHKVRTDNRIQLTNLKHPTSAFQHMFDRVCEPYSMEQRKTLGPYPWSHGQVARMHRSIKEATVREYF